jgi:hypothetical protein
MDQKNGSPTRRAIHFHIKNEFGSELKTKCAYRDVVKAILN